MGWKNLGWGILASKSLFFSLVDQTRPPELLDDPAHPQAVCRGSQPCPALVPLKALLFRDSIPFVLVWPQAPWPVHSLDGPDKARQSKPDVSWIRSRLDISDPED